ncbi:MAG: hypothetical protein WAM82_32040 [Thermoanaerobaculia bacterium]
MTSRTEASQTSVYGSAYGRDWYPYSMRRLRENPEVARHVLKAFLAGK